MKQLSIHPSPKGWVQPITKTSDVPECSLGTRILTENAAFEYIQFAPGSGLMGLAGMCTCYVDKDRSKGIVTSDISAAGGKDAYPAGVLVTPVAAGKYCWIQTFGEARVATNISVDNTSANASATGEADALAIGDYIMPSVDDDGGFAKLLRNDADTEAELTAALDAVFDNLLRVVGRVTSITPGAQTVQFDFRF